MRYYLFAGSHFYPNGGWSDFKGCFESIEHAKEHFHVLVQGYSEDEVESFYWFHIIDIETGNNVGDSIEQNLRGYYVDTDDI